MRWAAQAAWRIDPTAARALRLAESRRRLFSPVVRRAGTVRLSRTAAFLLSPGLRTPIPCFPNYGVLALLTGVLRGTAIPQAL
jgi:hypothetical protein